MLFHIENLITINVYMICKILYPLTNIEKLTNYKHVNLIKS